MRPARSALLLLGLHLACSKSPSPDGEDLGTGGTPAGGSGSATAAGGTSSSAGQPSGGGGAEPGAGGASSGGSSTGAMSAAGGGANVGGFAGADGGSSNNASGGSASAGGASSGGGGASGGLPGTVPSAGCTKAPTLTSGPRTIDVLGTAREYTLDVPESYDSARPYRLIFGFHGLMYDMAWVAEGGAPLTGPYFGIKQEAKDSTVFVAPQALSGGWSNQDGRDIDFVVAMQDEITTDLCIDESRIFSTGFSFGGIMTVDIGCKLAARFRAIAPMSARFPTDCSGPQGPLPYLSTHGLDDTTILPSLGEAVRDAFLAGNQCGAATTAADENGCVQFTECPAETPVTWCTFAGAHEPAPYAGPVIWDFFSQF